MKALPLALLALLPAWQHQEQVVKIGLTMRDGSALRGIPTTSSLTLVSSLGTHELAIKEINLIRFEGATATVECRDGSKLKGTLGNETFDFTWVMGSLKVNRDQVESLQYFQEPNWEAMRPKTPEPGSVLVTVTTNDGNVITGTADDLKPSFESKFGTFDVSMRSVSNLSLAKDNDSLRTHDGCVVKGKLKLAEFKVKSRVGEFTLKPEQVSKLSAREVQPSPAPDQPFPAPRPRPGAPSAAEPPPEPALKPLAKADDKSVMSRFLVSKDAKRVFAVNLSDGKLSAWSLPELKKDGEVALPDGEHSLAFDPRETRLVAVGKRNVSVLSLPDLKKVKSFAVEVELNDVVVLDDDILLATSHEGARTISISKSSVIQKLQGGSGSLRTSVDHRDRVFTMEGVFFLGKHKDGNGVEWLGGRATGQGSSFELSPDGRYGVAGSTGQVWRMGRSWSAGMVPMAKLEYHTAGAFSPDGKLYYALPLGGIMKIYETGDFTLVRSADLKMTVMQAWVEPGGTSILVSGNPAGAAARQNRYFHSGDTTTLGLYRFEIPK